MFNPGFLLIVNLYFINHPTDLALHAPPVEEHEYKSL
jgi:hypothetical protein